MFENRNAEEKLPMFQHVQIFLYFAPPNNCKLLSKDYSGTVLCHSYIITAIDTVPITSKPNETVVSKLWAKSRV